MKNTYDQKIQKLRDGEKVVCDNPFLDYAKSFMVDQTGLTILSRINPNRKDFKKNKDLYIAWNA